MNAIVNVIGIFRGFPKLSHITLSPYRIRVYGVSVVRDLPSGTASSPVSRTKRKPLSDQGLSSFYTKEKIIHPSSSAEWMIGL